MIVFVLWFWGYGLINVVVVVFGDLALKVSWIFLKKETRNPEKST